MQEYVTEAIVLNRELNGDLDARISLFTKHYGKLVPKAKSIRRITSKLSGHLDIGNCAEVRLIEKSGLQIVDALKSSRTEISPRDLYCIDTLLSEGEADLYLWKLLRGSSFSWKRALRALGWDPAEAMCEKCHLRPPAAFFPRTQEFFCPGCVSSFESPNELVYIK